MARPWRVQDLHPRYGKDTRCRQETLFYLRRFPCLSCFACVLGYVLLAPSLVHAASFDVPSNGDKLSGIGIIHGWKCEAEGDITVRFNDGDPIPATYGFPRIDTSPECGDDDGNNGFYTFFNWAILGDGEHTAVAYDNGVEFARSTFTVTTTGEEFLAEASARVEVEDFPSPGETTVLEWNQSTQHFEIVEIRGSTPSEPLDLGMCMVGLTVNPGEMCSGTLARHRLYFFCKRRGTGVYRRRSSICSTGVTMIPVRPSTQL